MVRIVVVLLAVLAGIAISAAESGSSAGAASSCAPAQVRASGDAGALVAADNQFGFRLFDKVLAGDPGKNVFVAPVSAALALDMIYDGARGSTRRAIATTLGVQKLTPASVRTGAAALLGALTSSDAQVRLDVANSVWARAGVPFRKAFVSDLARYYDGKAQTLDFTSPGAVSIINSWVSCATHGAISGIVDRIPADVVMYLINAMYFHGEWTNAFDPHLTRQQPFATAAGKSVSVPMMLLSQTPLPYHHGANFQAVALPYGASKRFDMVIVLPRAGVSLRTFAPQPTIAQWKSWTSGLTTAPIEISLPRFTLTNDWVLNSTLSDLGMRVAFGRTGNLSGMCARCTLSLVRQKTYLAVDEKGTTAAGTTSGGVSITALGPSMVVDHPFYLAIRDHQTGAILFAGAVSDPAG